MTLQSHAYARELLLKSTRQRPTRITMKEVEQVTLIRTSIATRGDGDSTPIRRITQWWTHEGELVAESDPCSVVVTEEQRRELMSIIGSLGLSAEEFGIVTERVARVLGRQNSEAH